MRRRAILLLTVMLAALVLGGGLAMASDTLDQQNTAPALFAVSPDYIYAQTFTAGQTGAVDKISVYVYADSGASTSGNLMALIFPTDSSGNPLISGDLSNFLGGGAIPLGNIPPGSAGSGPGISGGGWVDIPVVSQWSNTSGAPVASGTSYALVLKPDQPGYHWAYSLNNAYTAGGLAHYQNSGWTVDSQADFLFKTYVGPDTLHPTVKSEWPSSGATGVARNTDVTATFSEPMDPATINTSTVKMKSGKKNVPVEVSCSSPCTEVKINPYPSDPSKVLGANKKHKITITTGAEDFSGNALDQNASMSGNQPMVWTFTTGST